MEYIDIQNYRIIIPEEFLVFHIPRSVSARLKRKDVQSLIENQIRVKKAGLARKSLGQGRSGKSSYVFEELEEEIEIFACSEVPAYLLKKKKFALPLFSLTRGIIGRKDQESLPETQKRKAVRLLCGTLGRYSIYHATLGGKTVYFDLSDSENDIISQERISLHLEREHQADVEVIETGELSDKITKISLPRELLFKKKRDFHFRESIFLILLFCLVFSIKGFIESYSSFQERHQEIAELSRQGEPMNERLAHLQSALRDREFLPVDLRKGWDPLRLLKEISDKIYVPKHSWVEYFELDRNCNCITTLAINVYDTDINRLKKLCKAIRNKHFSDYKLRYELISQDRNALENGIYAVRLFFRKERRNGANTESKRLAAPYQPDTAYAFYQSPGIGPALFSGTDSAGRENLPGNESPPGPEPETGRCTRKSRRWIQGILHALEGESFGEGIAFAAEPGTFRASRHKSKIGQTDSPAERPETFSGPDRTKRERSSSRRDFKEITSLLESLKSPSRGRKAVRSEMSGGGEDARLAKFSDPSFKDFMRNPFKEREGKEKSDRPDQFDFALPAPDTASEMPVLQLVSENGVLIKVGSRILVLRDERRWANGKRREVTGGERFRLLECDPSRGTALVEVSEGLPPKTLKLREPFTEWKVDLFPKSLKKP